MKLFLKNIKFSILTIFIGLISQVQALEFKPTHIITDRSLVDISGEDLVWSDKTGSLKFNEVINFLSFFKNPNQLQTTIESNTDVSNDAITWHLSIIKNNSNKDFNIRILANSNSLIFRKLDENSSTVHLLKDNKYIKSIDTDISGKYNNLVILRWNKDHTESISRYDTYLISKNESLQILRPVGKTSEFNKNYLRLSEHQTELEINRLSLYLQGIGTGGFLILIFLSLYSAICKIEKSNKFFFLWLLNGLIFMLLCGFEGDRFSEFFLGNNSQNVNIEKFKIILGGLVDKGSFILFAILLSNLIDVETNFPKWKKICSIFITFSIILLITYNLPKLTDLDFSVKLPNLVIAISQFLYLIVSLTLSIGILSATIVLYIRNFPQAIYLLLAQILFIFTFFIGDILKFTLENFIDLKNYSLISELVNLSYLGLYLLQALVLNFSIIKKMKFLQTEVIAIGDKNRQILAEQNQTLEVKVKERTHELHLESQKSERLMLNILPQSIATRLKAGDESISDSYQNATILFSDLVGFTKMSSGKTAEELVFLLNDLFKRFDTRATSLGLEKIKTIGDAYMVAGGLPTNDDEHAIRVTKMALGMYEDLEAFNKEHGLELDMRIGINSGPVVAGVIGHSKFSYDLWGNTVNTASRMESTCLPGKVQVSPSTYEQIKGHFDVQENQVIECKGLGQIMTYFVRN
jgi:class 3 adenylate cyclase